ncbi:PIR Superfamily Protein [Plasmodium ovale wallikeri]|uniref:PIR Superfamily Protein n=1 Tax=Plasmodium ovale wallikeri TaxID=864142 RepID=A0A1A9AL84_PLAOA|nr:PIR Superfamily Protein [Plasmodium ovale wallikeri]
MACSPKAYQKQYEFLNYLEEYEEYENLAEQNGNNNIYNVNHSFIESEHSDYIRELTKMCKTFVYLIEKLLDRSIRPTANDDYDMDYLNYWLNKEINIIDSNNICKQNFFKNLRAQNNENDNFRKLNSKIYDIKEDELEDMNTLYTLYKKYNEINKTIKKSNSNKEVIIEYAKECASKYTTVKRKCSGESTIFCKKLTNFKKKYEEIDLCKYHLVNWTKSKLPPLTDDEGTSLKECSPTANQIGGEASHPSMELPDTVEDPLNIDTQSITIGVVVTLGIPSIFFILYKFTSIGTWMRTLMNKNEKLFENLDEKMYHFSQTYELEHTNSENSSYNIEYNAI